MKQDFLRLSHIDRRGQKIRDGLLAFLPIQPQRKSKTQNTKSHTQRPLQTDKTMRDFKTGLLRWTLLVACSAISRAQVRGHLLRGVFVRTSKVHISTVTVVSCLAHTLFSCSLLGCRRRLDGLGGCQYLLQWQKRYCSHVYEPTRIRQWIPVRRAGHVHGDLLSRCHWMRSPRGWRMDRVEGGDCLLQWTAEFESHLYQPGSQRQWSAVRRARLYSLDVFPGQ